MRPPDCNALKALPAYKAILKSVLKGQIQQLVEQLAAETGEESVLLTASVLDGSLSHLGSKMGKVFLQIYEQIEAEFLGFCRKHQNDEEQGNIETVPSQQGKRKTSKASFKTTGQAKPKYTTTKAHISSPQPEVCMLKISKSWGKSNKSSSKTKDTSNDEANVITKEGHSTDSENMQLGKAKTDKAESKIPRASPDISHVSADDSDDNSDINVTTEHLPNDGLAVKAGSSAASKASKRKAESQLGHADPSVLDHYLSALVKNNEVMEPGSAAAYQDSNLETSLNPKSSGFNNDDDDDDDKSSHISILEKELGIKVEALAESEMENEFKGIKQEQADSDELDWVSSAKHGDESCQAEGQNIDRSTSHLVDTADSPSAQNNFLQNRGRMYDRISACTCYFCGAQFTCRKSLLRHQRLHSNSQLFECDQCGKKFNEKGHFLGHLRNHSGEKLACDACHRTFFYKTSLKRHQKVCLTMLAEKKIPPEMFVCDICGYSCKRQDSLRDHISGRHKKEFKYKCSYCFKDFTYRSSLSKHMLIHKLSKI